LEREIETIEDEEEGISSTQITMVDDEIRREIIGHEKAQKAEKMKTTRTERKSESVEHGALRNTCRPGFDSSVRDPLFFSFPFCKHSIYSVGSLWSFPRSLNRAFGTISFGNYLSLRLQAANKALFSGFRDSLLGIRCRLQPILLGGKCR